MRSISEDEYVRLLNRTGVRHTERTVNPPKYRAKKVKTSEGTFDSKLEYGRWQDLKLLEQEGQIHYLERQVWIPLHAEGGDKVGHYVADYIYSDSPNRPYRRTGKRIEFHPDCVVEDAKGLPTTLYSWKAKHFRAEYGFPITEYRKGPKKGSKIDKMA